MEEKNLRLLIVDDEEAARYGMRRALETFGGEIAEAASAESARTLMRERDFDLLLLDVNLPGISGLEFLNQIQTESETNKAEAPLIVIITAHGSERLAVQAVKSGAHDYLAKPFELDDLRLVVKNALETIRLRRENRSLRRRIEIEASQRGALIGNSDAMQRVREMSANVQAKLLRALEERRIERLGGDESIAVDVRIVSATHRDLEDEIENGNFRADLFYRLRVVTIDIAPLRNRREDIPVLAATFARQAAERHGLPERVIGRDGLRKLVEYSWPGNVREL